MAKRAQQNSEAGGQIETGDRKWLFLLAPPLAVVVSLTLSYLWNEDFWWYLTSGRYILQHGGIPAADPFLYTSEKGLAWVYHSWLWTVLVAALDRLAGLGGVVVFHALLAVALSVLVYTTRRVDRLGLVNALALTLFLATIGSRLCGKAEVATWLMLAVFYRLLERGGGWTWKRGAALGALQVLWANLHGGYPLGIFVVLCYSLGGWIETRRGAKGPASYPPLWFPVLLFLLAVADPWQFRQRLAPFAFIAGAETVQPLGESGTNLILEWQSPFRAAATDPSLPWLYLLAAGAGLASFIAARRWPVPRLLFFLGMAGLAATAVRHMPGLGLGAALIILSNLGERQAQPEARPKKRRQAVKTGARARWRYAAACGLLALALLGAAVALRIARPGFDGGQSGSFFAIRPAITAPGAATFILEHDLPGPIFNDFQMGAYLSSRLYPKHRLFIDSRVLDPAVVVRYTEIVGSPERWKWAEQKYGFRTVVLGNYSKTVRSPLGLSLLRDPDWRLVYVDPLAVVFVRYDVPVEPVARLDLAFVDPPGLVPPLPALQRVFLNDYPAKYLVEYLAMLGQIGKPREVVELATRALAVMPEHPLLYRQRCAAHLALGDVLAAYADCEAAYRRSPEDTQVVALYSMTLDRAGKRGQALAVLEKALRQYPQDDTLRRLWMSLNGSQRGV
ncbi:MAG TPA: tetratricopeptide repeat protein [Thermoanaerobaculia bacterium]|nr:tetratricopeptide repeat protein [Thermoanaerobaculia bacterium]